MTKYKYLPKDMEWMDVQGDTSQKEALLWEIAYQLKRIADNMKPKGNQVR